MLDSIDEIIYDLSDVAHKLWDVFWSIDAKVRDCYNAARYYRHGSHFKVKSVQNFGSRKIKCLIKVELISWKRKFSF